MKLVKIFPILVVALAAPLLTACSDDDAPATVQDNDVANVRKTDATYNSLTFEWDKIAGVNQYGYTLTDADGVTVDEGVTQYNRVTLSDLKTDAQYNFELRVYGHDGGPSYRAAISASTLPIMQLAMPDPAVEQVSNRIRLSWAPVEGAGSYTCTYTIGDNVLTITTDEPQCEIAGLAPGSHSVSLMSLPANPGYVDSECKTVTVVRTRTEIATVTGTYTSGLMRRNNSWACTMHIFDDNTYLIDNFYDNAGYNLDLYVDSDPQTDEAFVGIYNFVSFPDTEYYVMDTGRASVPQIDMIPGLVDGVYGSTFTGDASSGTITINTRYSTASGTDKFVW